MLSLSMNEKLMLSSYVESELSIRHLIYAVTFSNARCDDSTSEIDFFSNQQERKLTEISRVSLRRDAC